MPVNTTPSDASRESVQVLLRDSTSISPACSDAKRCCELSGTYLTLSASLRTAAATARQQSTSSPDHLPWLSADEKPGPEVLTPHTTWPRAFTASSVLPACAAVARARPASVIAAVVRCLDRIDVSLSLNRPRSLATARALRSRILAMPTMETLALPGRVLYLAANEATVRAQLAGRGLSRADRRLVRREVEDAAGQ